MRFDGALTSRDSVEDVGRRLSVSVGCIICALVSTRSDEADLSMHQCMSMDDSISVYGTAFGREVFAVIGHGAA